MSVRLESVSYHGSIEFGNDPPDHTALYRPTSAIGCKSRLAPTFEPIVTPGLESQQRSPSKVRWAHRMLRGRDQGTSIEWKTRRRLGRRCLTLRPTSYCRMPRSRSLPHEQKRLARLSLREYLEAILGQVLQGDGMLERRVRPAEQEGSLRALAELERLDQELLERRNGRPFSPAWKLLDEARDERTRQLMLEG